jgi:flagellar biosynthesis/type III secretory pathway protein FliH
MKHKYISKIAVTAVFGAGLLMFSGTEASAQGNSQWAHEKNRVRKEQKQYEKAQKQSFRVYRGGSYCQTTSQGANLLRQAVNSGYSQGYRQGQLDRRYGRNGGYNSAPMYRSGTFGYQSYVDRSQYQYYFQQGFERGYQDGFNSQMQYGTYYGGRRSILGNVLSAILDIR